jgi:hypothetical protein
MPQITELTVDHRIDCSAELFKNDDVRETLKERAPAHNSAIDELGLPGFDEYVQPFCLHNTEIDVLISCSTI